MTETKKLVADAYVGSVPIDLKSAKLGYPYKLAKHFHAEQVRLYEQSRDYTDIPPPDEDQPFSKRKEYYKDKRQQETQARLAVERYERSLRSLGEVVLLEGMRAEGLIDV